MKIGINLLYIIPGQVGGTETYARELIHAMLKELKPTDQLTLFCGREARHIFKPSHKLSIVTLPFSSSNRPARMLVEQIILPFYTVGLDIIFSLGYSAPFLHFCPSIVTIHDLNWYYHPEDFNWLNRKVWEIVTKLSAATANHIFTDSSSSGKSLISVLEINPSKVTTILHGTPTKIVAKPYIGKHPYIFTVIAGYPHKNLSTLLKAFDIISERHPRLDLVVCGLGKQVSSTPRIKFLGYVSRQELASLYMGAKAFVFPSAYEGFGYPVIEAMSYGTPVISSNAASLTEVVGNGGILVDPYDVNAYVQAISKILKSSKVRQKIIIRGKNRVGELKWDKTASSTISILRKIIRS